MKSKKIVTICLILVHVFLYWVASQIAELVFDWLNMPIKRDYYLTIPELIALVGTAIVFVIIYKNQRIVGFLTEAVNELSKVSFPTKKEAGQSAVIVIVLVAIAALVLALYDLIWSTMTRWILN